ncbi:tetratricopeptide repeat protein [Kitasatospora cineracea]|uniref:Tetratricopeptide repeat protein n=1 Tax=Kitasatospora cineracea TaxID=88074 RepID=A0A8G1UBU3_9ACTN|nr:tetratricopeptide repeat protein [Kitasatospora cineracea]
MPESEASGARAAVPCSLPLLVNPVHDQRAVVPGSEVNPSAEPNRHLAAVLDEAGWTYEALARAVRAVAAESRVELRTSKAAVHHWVVNGTRPAGRTPLYIAEALSRRLRRTVTPAEIGLGSEPVEDTTRALPLDPLAAAADLGRLIMLRRRDFLATTFSAAAVGLPLAYDHQAAAAALSAAAGSRRIGPGEIAVVRQFTEMFRTADERLGGGHGLVAITSYLTDVVTPMLKGAFPDSAVRTEAFGAAAELATLIGWKLHDHGSDGAAQRFYLLAYQFACEADPAGRAAWAMRALAHQALDLGHHTGTAALADAALHRTRGRVDPSTEALLLITAARANGASGNRAAAAKLILAAENAMLAAAEPPPAYAAASGPVAATVASHTGKTLTAMKDHAAAERHYRAAVQHRVPGTYRRGRALTLANLAKTVAAQHRHEEAVTLWAQALDLMEGVASDRATVELDTMSSALRLYTSRRIRGAAELHRRAAALRRA